MNPMLSIITICKNEPYIEETCLSVVKQSNQNFEWLVVDGASTDDTLDKLSKYQKRMDIFISEEDNGTYFAMNKGIHHAHGKYLLFMNGGDLLYSKHTVANVLPYLQSDKADIFYGDSYRLFENEDDCFIKTYPDKITKSFFLTNTLAHQSSFIRKELFEKFGGYREDFKIVSDKEKWLHFIDKGATFCHIPEVLSCFRMNGQSRQQTPTLKAEKKKMLEEYFPKNQLYNTNVPYLQKVFDR
ncbi:MAG: glycosyltransferase family 2 protein [Rhodospirillales bacterium]|nr:glycosyltransferase family 2 protein [Rhodospirillales bacterium]